MCHVRFCPTSGFGAYNREMLLGTHITVSQRAWGAGHGVESLVTSAVAVYAGGHMV